MVDVILVNENDLAIGSEEKLAAHKKGLRHRCFSIFVFNKEGKLLLQQRAYDKYHSGGLWSNTCCSHQEPNEAEEITLHRRLEEEMGFDCPLEKQFVFEYKADLDHGICEWEFDHVFFGEYDGKVHPHPDEVSAYKWVDMEAIDFEKEKYTVWFKLILERVLEQRKKLKGQSP